MLSIFRSFCSVWWIEWKWLNCVAIGPLTVPLLLQPIILLEISVKFPATKGTCWEELPLSSRKPCAFSIVFVSLVTCHFILTWSRDFYSWISMMPWQFNLDNIAEEKISEVSIHLAKSWPTHRRTAFYCQEKQTSTQTVMNAS